MRMLRSRSRAKVASCDAWPAAAHAHISTHHSFGGTPSRLNSKDTRRGRASVPFRVEPERRCSFPPQRTTHTGRGSGARAARAPGRRARGAAEPGRDADGESGGVWCTPGWDRL